MRYPGWLVVSAAERFPGPKDDFGIACVARVGFQFFEPFADCDEVFSLLAVGRVFGGKRQGGFRKGGKGSGHFSKDGGALASRFDGYELLVGVCGFGRGKFFVGTEDLVGCDNVLLLMMGW